VAIKLLPAAFADDDLRLQRFQQEARATAALNHPSLLAVYDVGVHEGSPYLVFELLEGMTLRERLDAGPLTVQSGIDHGIQIAEGLAAAHAQGIAHRDLKPENVFLTADGRAKILDFGLAKLTSVGNHDPRLGASSPTLALTTPNVILGTIGYMAPEQARGGSVDVRADIFSFGCVLYEMIEGRRAFNCATPADTISAILHESPPDLTSSPQRAVSPALARIVRRCLEKEPAGRFQSASDLAFSLKSLTGAGTELSSDVRRALHQPRGRMREYLAAAGALGSLLVLGLLAFSPLRSGEVSIPTVTEFLVPPPSSDQSFAPMPLPGLSPTSPQVGISPDGRVERSNPQLSRAIRRRRHEHSTRPAACSRP
jgi:serine/threonine protein kinase